MASPSMVGVPSFQYLTPPGDNQGVAMRTVAIRGSVLVWILFVAVGAAPAWADLYSAEQAYKKSDFKSAFLQFKELAELGQPTAQYGLAVMYVRGEGTNQSYTYGHAWASLALAGGQKQAADLIAQIEPNLTPASLRISAEIQAQFSRDKLDARLMPHLLKGRDYADRDPVRPLKPFIPEYPAEAQRRGIQGEVYVEFIVPPDGHPRLPRILYAIPSGQFEDAVRESVLRSTYLPARINGQPVSTTVSTFYNFKIKNVNIQDYGDLASRVRATEAKAEAGDVSAQMTLGMMIAGLPQLNRTYDQAVPWFLKAAQAGVPYAQYQLGTGLMSGHGCQCDTTKGEVWLQKAAQADQADAQVTLAEYLLRDASNRDAVNGAMVWLERAAKNGNSAAKLRLSAIYAASPLPDLRNPSKAMTLSEKLEPEYRRDPSYWETRAAANAAGGDFEAAARMQSKALDVAKKLDWDLAKLQQRQSLYSSKQAWTGDLLSFD